MCVFERISNLSTTDMDSNHLLLLLSFNSTAHPEDFTPESVIFEFTNQENSTICVLFNITNNTDVDGRHTFNVEIQDIIPGTPHATIGYPSITTIIIIDDDRECSNVHYNYN